MKTNELNWALFYASLGWSVVPTHHVTIDKSGTKSCSCQQGADCISKGKHPAINWTKHQKERATKQQITEWFEGPYRGYSVGLITGSVSRMFVVDVDEGPGKDGGDTLAQLQLANDDLPPTPIAMPSRESILAAVSPEPTEDLFFVARGDGSHKFSRTLAEHQRAVREYQLKRRENYRSSPEPQP